MSAGSAATRVGHLAAELRLGGQRRRGEVVRRQLAGLAEVQLRLLALALPLEQQPQVLVGVRAVLVVGEEAGKASWASLKRQSSRAPPPSRTPRRGRCPAPRPLPRCAPARSAPRPGRWPPSRRGARTGPRARRHPPRAPAAVPARHRRTRARRCPGCWGDSRRRGARRRAASRGARGRAPAPARTRASPPRSVPARTAPLRARCGRPARPGPGRTPRRRRRAPGRIPARRTPPGPRRADRSPRASHTASGSTGAYG